MTTSIDPVAQAREYQELLLRYLGPRDPAEVQEKTLAALPALVEEAGAELRIRPADGEWSVIELAGHITDAEVVTGARYRWIVAHDRPALIGYDQDLWAAALHHRDADPAELLDLFTALRRANLALWRRSSADERARVGIHEERGPESFDLLFRLLGGHDLLHMEQARLTLEQVRGDRAGG